MSNKLAAASTLIAPDEWPWTAVLVSTTVLARISRALACGPPSPTRNAVVCGAVSMVQSKSRSSLPTTFSWPRRRTLEMCTAGPPLSSVARSGDAPGAG
eukprot:743401-Prymnesium_polylepis.1